MAGILAIVDSSIVNMVCLPLHNSNTTVSGRTAFITYLIKITKIMFNMFLCVPKYVF